MKLSDIPSLALLLLLFCSCAAFAPPMSIGGGTKSIQLFSTIEKDTVTTETNNAALLKRDRYIATNRKLILCFILCDRTLFIVSVYRILYVVY